MATRKTFQISEQQIDYLDTWMNRVSRSFAIVVPSLEEPLRHYLSTAYLICRVIDNIEDCSQPHAWKKERFSELEYLLKKPLQAEAVLATWEGQFWPGLNSDEERIMGVPDGLPLWEIFSSIPEPAREIIQRWTRTMANGMSQLDDPQVAPYFTQVSDKHVLQTKKDYDDYCYIVAGTVGHLATELVSQYYALPQSTSEKLSRNAEACGRGLQKTNIIKDFRKDLGRGISYLNANWMGEIEYKPLSLAGAPMNWIRRMFEDVLADLDYATEYLITLPTNALGYRKASLLCLLPAYQTLLLAAEENSRLFTPGHQFKISHETMAQCMTDTERLASDNEGIQNYSQDARQEIIRRLSLDTAPTIGVEPGMKKTLASRGA